VNFGTGTVPVSGGGLGGPPVRPELPVTVGPSSEGKKAPAPPITTGLGKAVDDLINKSPTLRELWAQAQKNGWQIQITETGRTEANPENKIITISKSSVSRDTPELMAQKFASVLSHELGHAGTPYPPKNLRIDTCEAYVNTYAKLGIDHEAAAAFANAEARWEIMYGDGPLLGPDIGIRGEFDDKYIDIHTRFKAGEISKEEALEEMAVWAAKETRGYGDGRVGTTEEVFRAAYEREWDEKH
jgi:type VI secretion system secreted protein VgrG